MSSEQKRTPSQFVDDIAAFHEKFALTYDGKPRHLGQELSDFRRGFMTEELEEYKEAIDLLQIEEDIGFEDAAEITHQLETALDSLVDLVYVALGTAYLHGFDFDEAWRRVHEANMRKVRAENESDSKRGSTFDVVKPKGWEPPSHKDLVEDNAHSSL